MAIVLNATWTAKAGSEHIILDVLRNLVPASRAEEGNLYYQAYQDPAQPTVFRIFEVYENKAALDAHAGYDHFKEWVIGRALPALEERDREFYETLDF
jgi:quinol monooxygenase YgiN